VIADNYCSLADTVLFSLLVRQPITLNSNPDIMLCRGNSFNYNMNLTGGRSWSYLYNLQDENNTFISSANSGSLSPSNTISYFVRVGDGGCSQDRLDTFKVFVSPLITDATIIGNDEGCEPITVDLQYPVTQAQTHETKFNWNWYYNGNLALTEASRDGEMEIGFSKSYPISGTFDVKVEMVMPDGQICETVQHTVNVWPIPVADFDYSPRQIDIVEPLVSFRNTGNGASTYLWTFDDGNSSTEENPKHLFPDTGLFTIWQFVMSDKQCADTTFQIINVLDIYRIFLPDAFSPNADEHNVLWQPVMTSTISIELDIYNRWGELI
jgi:PKD repeat protein